MAIARSPVQTWYTNTPLLDMRTLDIASLRDGRILVAFGGSSSVDSVVYAGFVDPITATLGPLETQIIPRSEGGVPSSTMGSIEIEALGKSKAALTMYFYNAAAGDNDTNFSLATQIISGSSFSGSPVAVNPGSAEENTDAAFDSVTLSNGRTLTFHTRPGTTGGFVNFTDGIQMTTFGPGGQVIGTPKTVVTDRVVSAPFGIEADPREPSAVVLDNGNIGLLYMENTSIGGKDLYYQQLTKAGAPVGAAAFIAAGIQADLTLLANGNMVASWFLGDHYVGQILRANGTKIGGEFDLTTTGNANYSHFEIVALKGGNFATGWDDIANGIPMGMIFDPTGTVLSNPFELIAGSDDFDWIGRQFGLTAKGNQLVAWINGDKDPTGLVTTLEARFYDGRGSLGLVRSGTVANNAMKGTAKDDTLDGGRGDDTIKGLGGQDKLIGSAGNDTLRGGGGFDDLDGGAGKDKLFGDAAGDRLSGGEGRDRLIGGAGNDRLAGGEGVDILKGGSGKDSFVFYTASEGTDRILDFSRAEGDTIGLAYTGGFAQFRVLTSGATLNTASVGFFFDTTTKLLSYDTDGSGANERVFLAELVGVTELFTSDLVMF